MALDAVCKVLVTGSSGFVGRNLCASIRQIENVDLMRFDLGQSEQELEAGLQKSTVIFHLAGVNRPRHEQEFQEGNALFTQKICDYLLAKKLKPKIIFTSSIQAEMDNPYGRSKKEAERILECFTEDSGSECVVYRLKNLFGKWCKPNYNAVTATFCHNIAHSLPIHISDPNRSIELTYIDDVVRAFLKEMDNLNPGFHYAPELPFREITLGDLTRKIGTFRNLRTELVLPDFSDEFERNLYATYLSYLDEDNFDYSLGIKSDPRGSLAEFLKSSSAGQIFISRTRPGIVRGNHYHHSKTEKFLVVQGKAQIRFRHIERDEVTIYNVFGEDYRVLDIPPGYTHCIENTGETELVTLFWASEVFDPGNMDTYYMEVDKKK